MESHAFDNPGSDPALSSDWLGICRRIVERQQVLFDETPTIDGRDRFEGIGEGGDHTLELDRKCEDVVFEELGDLAQDGTAFTAISEERGSVQFNGGGGTWVVIDPIDGSLNVRRTLPNHSLSIAVALLTVAGTTGVASADPEYSWKYYRPGNTGVMGDYSSGLWIAPDGTLYLGGYDPHFEEGGFSRFIEAENRWENFSNVDYPVIGDPANTGSSRISDFCQDDSGALWMGTWRGALYFDPAVGPDSFVRYDPETGCPTELPDGTTLLIGELPAIVALTTAPEPSYLQDPYLQQLCGME